MKIATLSNANISDILRSVAAVYLLTNENRFRMIAYQKAADTVEQLSRELKDIWEEGKLRSTPGIGPTIGEHLQELFEKGESTHFKKVLSLIPQSVFVLMKVPSLGPKKSFKLVKEFGFTNPDSVIEDVIQAAKSGKIEVIPTFGKKSQDDILAALELFKKTKKSSGRMPLPYAHRHALELVTYLKKLPLNRIDVLGSMRRMNPTIGDIDIAVATESVNDQEIIKHFLNYPKKLSVEGAGDKKASMIISPSIHVDLRVQRLQQYGSMLQYFTGSKAHNIKLREYALKKGLSLSEWGIKKVGSDKIVEFSDEESFYKYLDLDWIPPEIREGTNEVDLARRRTLPDLVNLSNIQGDLHTHSSYDIQTSHDIGENSYEEIVEKAHKLGYAYVGFSDHNPKTSGLSEKEIVSILKTRYQHIKKTLGKDPKVPYFIGIEADIQPGGTVAIPEDAVEYLDYIIVSIHSSFRQPKEQMTERVLKALSFPKVRIFGHPTGRLLTSREGIELDWKPIMELMKQNNQAFEINSWPERLDLPDVLVREAAGAGVKCIIDTDAHAVDQMDNMVYGVSVARRGWASVSDIINTGSYKNFSEWLINK